MESGTRVTLTSGLDTSCRALWLRSFLAATLIPYPPEPTPVPTPTLPPWLLLLPLTVSVFDAEDSRTSREALTRQPGITRTLSQLPFV